MTLNIKIIMRRFFFGESKDKQEDSQSIILNFFFKALRFFYLYSN